MKKMKRMRIPTHPTLTMEVALLVIRLMHLPLEVMAMEDKVNILLIRKYTSNHV
jgi:hypothetical protein